jgi:hypothetical protein
LGKRSQRRHIRLERSQVDEIILIEMRILGMNAAEGRVETRCRGALGIPECWESFPNK